MVNYLNYHVVIKMFQTGTSTELFLPSLKVEQMSYIVRKKVTVTMFLNYAGRQNYSDN